MISNALKKRFERCADISKSIKEIEQEARSFHCAFLYNGNKLISIGINRNKTHPKNLNYNYHTYQPGLHAEHDAILKAKKRDCADYSMIVLRVDNNGKIAYSCPCSGCKDVLIDAGIEEVYFSNSDGDIEKLN